MKTVKMGDSYFVSWHEAQVVLEFSRLHEHRDTLTAELSVTNEAAGALHWSRVNMASATGRSAVVKALQDGHPGVPWRTVLDRSCQSVAAQLRVTEPRTVLQAVKPDPGRWLCDPWIPLHETTVLYGDGGTGKSLLALTWILAGLFQFPLGGWAIGPIRKALYLDWESDSRTHEWRLWGLTQPIMAMPPGAIEHRYLTRPLTDELETIRKDVAQLEPDFIVCDSLGAACGPEPESGDAAIRTLMALRSLGRTRLVIAHVSKASADQRVARPFGSVYVQNLARSTIEVRRSDDEESSEVLTQSLYHRKANFGRLAKPSGIQFTFDNEDIVTIQSAKADPVHGSLATRILAALKGGKQTATAIAESVAVSEEAVRATLGRLENRNRVVKLVAVKGGRGQKAEWGLADTNRNT